MIVNMILQLQEFYEGHWGDLVSLFMLGVGGVIIIHSSGNDQAARDFGKTISAAGLMGLKLTGKLKASTEK